MRNSLLFCMMLLGLSSSMLAQNPQLKSGVVFKKMFLDYQSQNGGSFSEFKEYRSGWEIGYQRMLSDKVALNLPFRYGVVNKYTPSESDSLNCIKKRIASLDAQFQYQFAQPGKKIIPYVLTGVGGVYEKEGDFNIQIPVGLGLYFRLTDNAFVNWQSEYRYSLADNRNNLQHGLGFIYLFGKTKEEMPTTNDEPKVMTPLDSDKDGVIDELDICPTIFGAKELNGCPDKDEDGVADYLDKCPDMKGLKAFNGCPDTDGDGVADNEDECPKVAGLMSNKGCPAKEVKVMDSDGDGVADDVDKCPNERGNKDSMGCPDGDGDGVADYEDKCPSKPGLRIYNGCPDSDGDGIDDSRDKCPNLAGTVANEGCPEINKEDKKTLEVAMQAVQFQTGSAVLKTESHIVLGQIADIMNRYPDFNMSISGHTDNTGSSTANQTLSERRAKACFDYLVREGVSASRMSSAGFGESRPISTNENERGRSLNRRVEFNLVPRG